MIRCSRIRVDSSFSPPLIDDKHVAPNSHIAAKIGFTCTLPRRLWPTMNRGWHSHISLDIFNKMNAKKFLLVVFIFFVLVNFWTYLSPWSNSKKIFPGPTVNIHFVDVYFDSITRGLKITRVDNTLNLTQIDLQAKNLGVIMPREYSIGHCHNALVTDFQTWECNVEGSTNIRYYDLDLVYAIDFYIPNNFQHDYINAVPLASMSMDWVNQKPKERAFLCATRICPYLRAALPDANLIDYGKQFQFPFRARSLNMAFNDWVAENLTIDTYPVGSLWFVDELKPRYTGNNVLFLSRNYIFESRYMWNENQLIEKIATWAKNANRKFIVLEKFNNLDEASQRRLFQESSLIIGVHGGAFSNIAHCNINTTVIEINNGPISDSLYPYRRDCFAYMALAKGLNYIRVNLSKPIAYHGIRSHFSMAEEDMNYLMSKLV